MKCEECGGELKKVNDDYPPLKTYECQRCGLKIHKDKE